jgi:hypothetical protein
MTYLGSDDPARRRTDHHPPLRYQELNFAGEYASPAGAGGPASPPGASRVR